MIWARACDDDIIYEQYFSISRSILDGVERTEWFDVLIIEKKKRNIEMQMIQW